MAKQRPNKKERDAAKKAKEEKVHQLFNYSAFDPQSKSLANHCTFIASRSIHRQAAGPEPRPKGAWPVSLPRLPGFALKAWSYQAL